MKNKETSEIIKEIKSEYKKKLRLNGMSDVTIYNKISRLKPFFKAVENKPVKDVTRKDIGKCCFSIYSQVSELAVFFFFSHSFISLFLKQLSQSWWR
jgi:hypothetical protein